MFRGLFKRKRPAEAEPMAAEIPEGCVVWAVGDIHGRLDLLEPLLAEILSDLDAAPARRKVVVFLGDYVDRGPDSRGVIDRLCSLAEHPSVEAHFLKGNHEDKLIEFLTDPTVGKAWCEYGGAQALKSFGLTPPTMAHRPEGWAALSADLDHRLTARQRAFLEALETSVVIGGYFFVHAGARPEVALGDQTDTDLMWIRETFLKSDWRFEQVVVHGHTPANTVHSDARRIGVDTGAYASGVLSAVRLEGRARETLQAIQESAGGIAVQRQPLA
jgi:serine/threonine protein phosphatase 1